MTTEDQSDFDDGTSPTPIENGTLLFEPSGVEHSDDEGEAPPEDEPRSRAPIYWALAALLLVAGSYGLPLIGGSDPVTPPSEATPLAPTVPIDTASRAQLRSIPSDTVRGPVNSSVRLAVRVWDRNGAPHRGATLRFTLESGDGSLREEEAEASGEGIAVSFLDLPSVPGISKIRVSLVDDGLDPAVIVAVAQPGPPDQITISGGSGQQAEVGRLLPDRAEVTVVDSLGNPIPGAIVTFQVSSGDGMSAPSQARADSLGRAGALWRLGPVEGEQTLRASVSGIERAVTFTATATPAATLEIFAAQPTAASAVTVSAVDFAIGGSHACALSDDTLRCWGDNGLGQSAPAGRFDFVAVFAGAAHSCGLNRSGIASCWGANDAGQLGDGTRDNHLAPARISTEIRFSELALGADHTCGLAGGGVPLCWGENLNGQLGDGTRIGRTAPRTVGGGLGFREIAAGWSHTCGRTVSGNTFCWGANTEGQLGDGSRVDKDQPSRVSESVSSLVAGSAHTCGIAQGGVLCWGANASGQLGDGSTTGRNQPTAVVDLPGTPVELAAGAVHTCARISDGRIFCWGQNRQGQVGDGTTETRVRPAEVTGGLRFESVRAGGAQTCGTTREGTRYCWGLNLSGQLGDGTRSNRSTPTAVRN